MGHKELIESFINDCFDKGIYLSQDNFSFVDRIGVVVKSPNILGSLNTILKQDKDYLVNYRQLREQFRCKPFNAGYFYCESYIAMASHLFRRSLFPDNHWSPGLIYLITNIHNPDIDISVAVDFDCVKIDVNDSCYREKDTWYGAKYSDEISSIKDGDVKLAPPLDLSKHHCECFFNNCFCLDISWTSNENIKTFQAIEFQHDDFTIELYGKQVYPAKYFHSEFDLKTTTFRHVDAAIHFYSEEEYYNRRDKNFDFYRKGNQNDKASSTKLFKLNGIIEQNLWEQLCSLFFHANPLLFEYFEERLPDYLVEILEKIRINTS